MDYIPLPNHMFPLLEPTEYTDLNANIFGILSVQSLIIRSDQYYKDGTYISVF